MSYQTRDTAGTAVILAKNDRISSVNGQACEYYVKEVIPRRAATRRPRLKTWPVLIAPTSLADGAVDVGTVHTLAAQVEFEEAEGFSPGRGPSDPSTKGYFWVRNADRSNPAPLLKVIFADAPSGQAYANAYLVELITRTWVGQDLNRGKRGTPTDTPTPIDYVSLTRSDGLAFDGTQTAWEGELSLVISKSVATEAELKGAYHIRITPSGGTPVAYSLVNRTLKDCGNHQWELHLQRVTP